MNWGEFGVVNAFFMIKYGRIKQINDMKVAKKTSQNVMSIQGRSLPKIELFYLCLISTLFEAIRASTKAVLSKAYTSAYLI